MNMNEIIELIEDKISECDDETDFEDLEITQDYLKGYINGLNMSIYILKEKRGVNNERS